MKIPSIPTLLRFNTINDAIIMKISDGTVIH